LNEINQKKMLALDDKTDTILMSEITAQRAIGESMTIPQSYDLPKEPVCLKKDPINANRKCGCLQMDIYNVQPPCPRHDKEMFK